MSREEIENLYARANLVLLPYLPSIYHYRGSAVHYEAIVNKVPVLARKGVGFAGEIAQWSSGWTYETKQELLECLRDVQNMNPTVIEEKMCEALRKFQDASDEAANFNLS